MMVYVVILAIAVAALLYMWTNRSSASVPAPAPGVRKKTCSDDASKEYLKELVSCDSIISYYADHGAATATLPPVAHVYSCMHAV